ncbi:pheromone processing endoprotease [Coemansia sp. RSA 1813]|nr:pheromone processing endoprotease [Coemansia sp. RSA 1646]KAJ1772592.1 pheromone processing endoprotease [Coemansia sp. RSA 1843]KAJ2091448.1 pheromone processing endoprotease [Coemansia sp. RSA 986]KAJ2213888.1 pheromone processing endoprotease [Coemansia sp. RSA 487]KAJ2570664.1 pheromone processing endoprotease [Coemansia sp. RSA 1813]
MKISLLDLVAAMLGLTLSVSAAIDTNAQTAADGSGLEQRRMLKVSSWLGQAAHAPSAIPRLQTDPNYDYAAVKFATDDQHIDQLAHEYALSSGWENAGPLGSLPKYRVFRKLKSATGSGRLSKRNARAPEDVFSDPTVVEHVAKLDMAKKKRLFKRSKVLRGDEASGPVGFGDRRTGPVDSAWRDIVDPQFTKQWHLANIDDPGNDINVTHVWKSGVTGAGVTVALIDDGLDYTSDDLLENFDFRGSYDFNDKTKLPTPRLKDDYHGTRCAGQIAAVRNDVCGVGVAYNAKVAGIRMLSKEITDQDEILALNYAMDTNWIYSCSWGPNDDGKTVQAPDKIVEDAFINGVENGRGGLGSLFVFATGNGGTYYDNCNFDGYTNSIYTISIGALDHRDKHSYYSEQCSAHLAVTYSSGEGKSIVTTDLGLRSCTDKHGGTSAAAPLAAGIYALVLSVRPDLTWRDVQHLTARTAIPVDTHDSDWDDVAMSRKYNHKYGFGKMDASRIVEAARTMEKVGRQTKIEVARDDANANIPVLTASGGQSEALVRTVEITKAHVADANMKRVEHVTVVINMEHQYRGNVEVWLESPSGIRSQLAAVRNLDNSNKGLDNWKFMSVKHWDDDPVGKWRLHVRNAYKPNYTGTLRSWQLTVYGESTEKEPEHRVPSTDNSTMPSLPSMEGGGGSKSDETETEKGLGTIRTSVAALMNFGFFATGAVVSAMAVLFFMRRRERKLESMRWTAMDPIDSSGGYGYSSGPSRHSMPERPEDDEDVAVFEFEDRAGGLSSSSTQAVRPPQLSSKDPQQRSSQHGEFAIASSDEENDDDDDDDDATAGDRTHGNASQDSQEARESARLV